MKRSPESQLTKDDFQAQQSRDDDNDDDANGEPHPMSEGFAKAPPDVLARRRIIKVRRTVPTPAQSSVVVPDAAVTVPPPEPEPARPNPFANIAMPSAPAAAAPASAPAAPVPAVASDGKSAEGEKAVVEGEKDAEGTEVKQQEEKAEEQAAEKVDEEVAGKADEEVTEKSVEKATEKVTEKDTEKVVESASEKVDEKEEKQVEGKGDEKPVEATTDKPIETSAEKTAEPTVDKPTEPADKSAEAAQGTVNDKPAESKEDADTNGTTPPTTEGAVPTPNPNGKLTENVASLARGTATAKAAAVTTETPAAPPARPFSFGGLSGAAPAMTFASAASAGDTAAPFAFKPPPPAKTSEPAQPAFKEAQVETGEEHERELFRARAKLYNLESSGKDARWKERGVGSLKLNLHKETGRIRLLMRTEATLRVVLNTTVFPGFKLDRATERSLRFQGFETKGTTEERMSFLIRFSTEDDTNSLVAAIEKWKTWKKSADDE